MGNKPIEFKPEVIGQRINECVLVEARQGQIVVRSLAGGIAGDVYFSDPAKLDALAKAITDAAAALRRSQQLTFADLKPGEWFKWASSGEGRYAVRKVDNGTIINPENWSDEYPEPLVCMTPVVLTAPVIRVTATFTPAPADEVGR